jgi:hypothetical protein
MFNVAHTSLTLTFFSILVSILLSAIWSHANVYAQQISSSSGGGTSTLSSELKAKMCDPSNPSLKVVNTTESNVCGIPKTVKPSLASTPPTSAVSSPTASTINPTSTTSMAVPPPKQQQITNTSNKSNNAAKGPAITPISKSNSRSLLVAPTIAPQTSQQEQLQQPQPPLLLTKSNNTAMLNYTFTSTFPAVTPGKLVYLGYHDDISDNSLAVKKSTAKSDHSTSDSDSKDKRNSDTNPHSSTAKKSNSDTNPHSSTAKKSNSDGKSHSHDKNDSKAPSKKDSKSNNDKDHDSNGKKKKNSSKGHNGHKGGGDSFFGGDPFF